MKRILFSFILGMPLFFCIVSTVSAASPTILDTIPDSGLSHQATTSTSISFSYTVPAGGQNKLMIALVSVNQGNWKSGVTTASLNGVDFKANVRETDGVLAGQAVLWLAAPTTGTFQLNWTGSTNLEVTVFTLQDAAQTSSFDVWNASSIVNEAITTSTTTVNGSDFLAAMAVHSTAGENVSSYGAGQSAVSTARFVNVNWLITTSWKAGAASPGSESMTTTFDTSRQEDQFFPAFKYLAPTPSATASSIESDLLFYGY